MRSKYASDICSNVHSVAGKWVALLMTRRLAGAARGGGDLAFADAALRVAGRASRQVRPPGRPGLPGAWPGRFSPADSAPLKGPVRFVGWRTESLLRRHLVVRTRGRAEACCPDTREWLTESLWCRRSVVQTRGSARRQLLCGHFHRALRHFGSRRLRRRGRARVAALGTRTKGSGQWRWRPGQKTYIVQ
jgi:hypothetical protein